MSFCNLSLLPSSMRQVQNQVANTFLHLQNFFYEILKMYKEDAYYTKVWVECSKDSYQSEISYLFHNILWGTPLLLNLMKVDSLVKFDETRKLLFSKKISNGKIGVTCYATCRDFSNLSIAKSICQNSRLYRPFPLLKALWEDVSMNFVVS